MVGEIVKTPAHEPKAYSIMPFVWSIGTIVGPAIGGMLARPAEAYPDTFSEDGLFGHFPWLLPNLVCALIMLVSIIGGFFWLEETHPDLRKGAHSNLYHDIAEQTPMIAAAGAVDDTAIDLRQEFYGTFDEVDLRKTESWHPSADGTSQPSSISDKHSEKWFNKKIAMLTVALGLYTYHSMCYDHLLPIFFQDNAGGNVSILASSPVNISGGLGLSTKSVGIIMSVDGLIAVFVQAVIFPFAAEHLGIWRIFVLVTILHPVTYFIVPYLAILPENLLYPGIYTCLTIRNLLSIVAYPVILILLKQASPSPSVLGRINGLAVSAGAACRTVAPPVAGLLYGWGMDVGFTGLAWWGAGVVAIVGVFQLWFVPRDKNESTSIKSMLPYLEGPIERKDLVVVEVTEVTEVDDEERV